MKIDFQAEKTEAEWQEIIDSFWLQFTPKWFEWLGWVFVIGAIRFVDEKTTNIAVSLLHGFSYVALFFYFQGFFFQAEFVNIPFVRSASWARFVSLLISGILATGVYLLLRITVPELTAFAP